MPLASRLRNLATWPPLQPGEPAPELSLTAQDGTWIRMPDFLEKQSVALLFLRSPGTKDAGGWLQAIEAVRPQLEELDCIVFAVTTVRTDQLREIRSELGLGFSLLFDPLAVDARGFRCASRWRPLIKDTVVLVGKTGQVAWSSRSLAHPRELLQAAATLQGVNLDNRYKRSDVQLVDSEAAVQLLEADGSPWLLLDVRTRSEFDADHAPQAVHIPVDELPQRYAELGQTDHILCVCQAGGRSAAAAEFLVSIGGTEIANVEGGMSGWTGNRVTGGVQE